MKYTSRAFWGVLLTCFMVATISARPLAQEETFTWPEHKVSAHFKGFLAAYNANSSEVMKAFLLAHGNPEKADTLTDYWSSVFVEYGEVQPFTMDEGWSAEHRLALWFKGKVTQGWVMILLSTDPNTGKLAGKGVLRGHRPAVAVPPFQPITPQVLKNELAAHLEVLADQQLFSGSVLVAKGEKVLLERAVGLADRQAKTQNEIATVFNTASVTKLFTSFAIAQLIEKGQVKLDDTLAKWVPDYPRDVAEKVTIKHLLTHTSGIELDDHAPFNQDIQQAESVEQIIAAHLRHLEHMNEGRRQNFQVLERFDYSNENFHLLGAVIEKASGMAYLDYLAKFILAPADMDDALAHLQTGKGQAQGYTRRDKDYQPIPEPMANSALLFKTVQPSGCLYVSAGDLYRFFRALNEHKLVGTDMLEQMLTAHTSEFESGNTNLAYGLGVSVQRYGSAYAWGHSGAMQGAGAQSWYFPEQDMYVMVLGNNDPIASQHLLGWVRDRIAPLP